MSSKRKPRGEVFLGVCFYENRSLDSVIREAIKKELVFENFKTEDVMNDNVAWVSKDVSTEERALIYLKHEKNSDRFVLVEHLDSEKYGIFSYRYIP